MHVKSFSYMEWPEPTKTMLIIHNADKLWPNVLIQTRWPTINFESIVFSFVTLIDSFARRNFINGMHLMCLRYKQFQRDVWHQAMFTFLLDWIQIQMRLYVQYRERHVGNVNCFHSPCCLVPAVLIKCKDITFLCVMRAAFLPRVILIWQKGKHEQRKGRKQKKITI